MIRYGHTTMNLIRRAPAKVRPRGQQAGTKTELKERPYTPAG